MPSTMGTRASVSGRHERNAALLLNACGQASQWGEPAYGVDDDAGAENHYQHVGGVDSQVEGLPNSQLSDFATALEEVGVRAVSTEWHVHLVREAESQHQFRRDSLAGKCQLCVQCPNGRKHSSLFAIHLLPHWLEPRAGADEAPQDTPMTCTGIKTAAMAIDKLSDPDPAQHCLVSACLSDWLTGEVYPDAVVFSTHPNGHLFGDKQTDMLQMPICSVMKALMKIKRPLDPRNPSEQLPLHKLSTLKLTLSCKFTRGDIQWEQDFISPGVIKLVSRVTDRALEDAETIAPKRGKREEEIAKQEEELAASILLGRPAPSAPLQRFPAPPNAQAAPPAPAPPAALTPQQELRREAHKHSETFLRAFAHNPEATLSALEAVLVEPANLALPSRNRKRGLPKPTTEAGAPDGAPEAAAREGARTRRLASAGSSDDRQDVDVLFELVADDSQSQSAAAPSLTPVAAPSLIPAPDGASPS